ncbi:hypothetical protein R6Y95_03200 [Methanoculleus palmolei]|uniref:Uncharacterized protein n=1 Tax=Methanoculleus palmolei TaxID=72612 RepID=A0ABD8AA00_9EURY|nr:hypothetical protein R6Y95_03200 [Methanoculleus palmolei]
MAVKRYCCSVVLYRPGFRQPDSVTAPLSPVTMRSPGKTAQNGLPTDIVPSPGRGNADVTNPYQSDRHFS